VRNQGSCHASETALGGRIRPIGPIGRGCPSHRRADLVPETRRPPKGGDLDGTTFQIDKHLFLRAIVQYDSSRRQVLTDFLASWELLPGTVVYAGYGSLVERRGWDGWASYIHRF